LTENIIVGYVRGELMKITSSDYYYSTDSVGIYVELNKIDIAAIKWQRDCLKATFPLGYFIKSKELLDVIIEEAEKNMGVVE
jgi:hypothetical protein